MKTLRNKISLTLFILLFAGCQKASQEQLNNYNQAQAADKAALTDWLLLAPVLKTDDPMLAKLVAEHTEHLATQTANITSLNTLASQNGLHDATVKLLIEQAPLSEAFARDFDKMSRFLVAKDGGDLTASIKAHSDHLHNLAVALKGLADSLAPKPK